VTLPGRERECARIDALLAGARRSRGGALLIRGEAGAGKTELLQYALRTGEGMRALEVSAAPWESDVPYAGVHALLSSLASAAGPLVFLVDDADALDDASAKALAFAARRVAAQPVAFLFAATEGFRGAGLPELRVEPLAAEVVHLATLSRLALDAVARNRFKAAGHLAAKAARLAEDRPDVLCRHRAVLAWVAALRGCETECREHAEAACDGAAVHDVPFAWHLATLALGELALGLGRNEEALAQLSEVWEAGAERPLDLLVAPSLVEAAVRIDRRDLAEDVTAAYAALDPPPALLARSEAVVGTSDAAFARAIALHVEEGDHYGCARTRLLYGESLRRARRRREARRQLHAAHQVFEKLGAAAWARRAAGELRGSGVTANRRDTSRLDELTAQ
jgi:hypothetical protein